MFHVYDQDRAGSISKSQLVTIYCRVLTAIGTPIPLARKAHGEAHAREAFAKVRTLTHTLSLPLSLAS